VRPRGLTISNATFDWFTGFKREMSVSETSPTVPRTVMCEETAAILDQAITLESTHADSASVSTLFTLPPANLTRPKRDYLEARQVRKLFEIMKELSLSSATLRYRPYSEYFKSISCVRIGCR
jgi:hypothetical protein